MTAAALPWCCAPCSWSPRSAAGCCSAAGRVPRPESERERVARVETRLTEPRPDSQLDGTEATGTPGPATTPPRPGLHRARAPLARAALVVACTGALVWVTM